MKHNELLEDEVQMLYDRMMERVRFDDIKFKLVATGSHPKPELQVSELATKTADKVETGIPMSVPEAMDDDRGEKSPEVVVQNEKSLEKKF